MADLLPPDEQYVLAHWSIQAVAEELNISEDAACDLLEAAWDQGRIQMRGNSMFAGVQVDGRWVVVEGRRQITAATREWQTLRAMERQLED
jgi:DNA-binding transcriptional regulator LsrR (DeoR family)